MRCPDGSGPAASRRPGAAAQARLRHPLAALPDLRQRGPEERRGYRAATRDREDPHPPAARFAAAAPGQRARSGAGPNCLNCAGRRKHDVPGCNRMSSRGGSACHVRARPQDRRPTPRARQQPALVRSRAPAEPNPAWAPAPNPTPNATPTSASGSAGPYKTCWRRLKLPCRGSEAAGSRGRTGATHRWSNADAEDLAQETRQSIPQQVGPVDRARPGHHLLTEGFG